MRDLLVATTNAGKLGELSALLPTGHFRVRAARDVLDPLPTVVEDGTSFAENARKKAEAIARESLCLTLADDSGLEVDALGGAPGVHSARFSGADATDAENRAELIARLRALGVAGQPFSARFRCALCLLDPLARVDGRLIEVEGVCPGTVILEPRGNAGFGYDALFVPAGSRQTFAEVSPAEKHARSHRGTAIAALIAALQPGART